MKPIAKLEAREKLMAQLAEKAGSGRQVTFHGTRHLDKVIRDGVLYPSLIAEPTISFTRSAKIAAYFALMPGNEIDLFSGGVLVLDRKRLRRYHCVERVVYDETEYSHEEEEQVWDEAAVFKHLLIAVVIEVDLDKTFEERGEQHCMGKVLLKDIKPEFGCYHASEADFQRAKERFNKDRLEWQRRYGAL